MFCSVDELVKPLVDSEEGRMEEEVESVNDNNFGNLPVITRESAVVAVPFLRNGWGAIELEKTYDEDEEVVPVNEPYRDFFRAVCRQVL
jgi:hypothetical protein